MWKIVVGFIAFAAFALYILSRGGDIDMSGEKHGTEATHVPAAEPAASAASAVLAPASAASPAAPAKPVSAP